MLSASKGRWVVVSLSLLLCSGWTPRTRVGVHFLTINLWRAYAARSPAQELDLQLMNEWGTVGR